MAEGRGPLRVVGRYALYNEIAAGGMATVHIGRLLGPVGFARTVAVKRLHPQFAKDPEFVSMFLDEARLAARVQHPNVVATIDVVATDGELFLIMDYIRGESLSKLLRSVRKNNKRMPPRIVASICSGFLHGLHAAHEAKNERGNRIDLVHRDVSPQNVLVGADGIARVLDFGIAKAAGRVQVTREGQIKGKLAYMPPEQLSGRELTRAVDIYASAVVIWEALTGERLFKGETERDTLAKILIEDVLPPSAIVPELGTAFDAPLLKALSREPRARHATARELAFEIEKCAGVASGSEVGEWVENLVGSTLSAREEEVAEIESNSSSLRISPSGNHQTADSDSDSDYDVAPVRSRRASTLVGVGTTRETVTELPDATDRMTPTRGLSLPPAPSAPSVRQAGAAPAAEEGTGSKLTGSRWTEAMMLPVDAKLPIVACALGLLVLLLIMGVVLFRRGSGETVAGDPAPVASASGSASVSAVVVAAPASTIPDPPPPVMDPAPPASSQAAAVPSARPTVHAVASPPPAPKPPVAAAPRKDCTPPYTIDANGRKKYKLECM